MQTRIAALTHVGTLALGRMHAAMFELMRGEHARAAQNAFELVRLTREYDLNMWGAFGVFLQGLAASHTGAPTDELEDMRRGAELLREQNVLMFDGLLKVALADAEARAGDSDRAVSVLDEALATSDRTEFRAFEAELHRVRGEMLMRRDPGNPAPPEEAFQTAIAVAKQQGTRSFELRAALSLATLYQSAGRPAEAYALLAPALDGFPPTSQMPEFAEAQAMLAALSHSHEVKAQAAERQRLTQLQVAYGNALVWARGYGAPETTEAFARARESRRPARATRPSGSRPTTASGPAATCGANWRRCELTPLPSSPTSRRNPNSPEAGIAHRGAGVTCLFAGEYVEARRRLERALALF